MGSFVENVNKLASDLSNDLINNITTVAGIAGDITELVDIHDSGELPLINDATPSSIDVFSSAKVQAMHDAQAEAIANLSSASGSLVDNGVNLSLTTSFQNLEFLPVVATTNSLLFEVMGSEIEFKANGVYNFFSSVTLTLNSGATKTVTFEVYDKVTPTTVYSTTVGTINGSNGDILGIQLNTLLDMASVPFGGSVVAKVRAKVDSVNNSVILSGFNSMLVLSGAAGGGGQLLGIAPIKGVQYMSSVSAPNETITVTNGLNAFSVDSFTLADGASIVVEDNAVYKVL